MDLDFVLVKRKDVERLTTEVMQMREFLPQILTPELLENVQRLEVSEIALEAKELDCAHISARLEVSQGEYLQAKEENLSLAVQLNDLREHSLQQAEYCTRMGSALCTLLWGVSNREETVRSILAMDKAAEFFALASHTVGSFVESLGREEPPDEDTEESRFVLGLAGTITNVAAVPCGRDFLISSCKDLMEKWFQLLGKVSLGSCSRLRVLILMSLYNVSINRSGLVWLSQCAGIISRLQVLLSDPDPEVCLHALRLFQSVVLDAEILQLLWGEIRECLPRVRELSQSDILDVQRSAGELLEEVRGLEVES